MYNGQVVPMSFVPPVVAFRMEYNDETIAKVRELKKTMLQVLMAKKHMMDEDETMEFLKIDEMLCSWINNTNSNINIEAVVLKTAKVLKTYGKTVVLP